LLVFSDVKIAIGLDEKKDASMLSHYLQTTLEFKR
jgi:hypothetical protein